MSKMTRRQVIRAGVAAGALLSTGTASAGSENNEPDSLFKHFLPEQLTKEELQPTKDGTLTKLQFAGSTFWVRCVNIGYGTPHTFIGVYAPVGDGIFHRSLFAESWAAGNIEATVNAKTGILELYERANSNIKGQLVLSCNLKTIGTPHSVQTK